jgi:hypothetical protein
MKIKFKFNIKPFFNYLSVILATAFGITMILIALPLTEKISEKTSFDLITKDSQYWSSEYILKLESTDKLQIESTRDILFNRLKKFNVERAKIYHSGEDEEGFTYLRVVITSTLPKDLVKELVSNRFDVQIMTRKEDVDFFDQEDQYAYLFADNYNPTDWDRSDFRNIYITNLKTSSNEYANFALFKLWPNKQGEFQRFLEKHKGEYLGVSIDGFVTPYLVPFDDFSIFAVPVSTEDEVQIEAIDILYNSGVIPVNYSIDSENDMEADIVRMDHIKISIGLAISLLLTYIYLFMLKQSDKNTLIKSFLATVLTISTYLAVLKIMQIPVDTFILPIVAILSFLLTKVLSENDDSVHYLEIGLILILLLVRFLGFGYMPIVATHLIALIILSKVYLIISDWYIYKVKSI